MEKLKMKKTGFTLVELLVVIAILAVLASVSVIGYLSFVKKSKVSNDSSLITQMNTTLQANEAVDGKNATAHDAIEELYESGLDVNKLSPTTEGYHYAIDMSQNRAFLLDGYYNKVAPENLSISSNKEDVFVMVSSYGQISTVNNEGYSVYLKNGFDWGTQTSKEITTSKGIDVGDNEVTTIKYENKGTAQNVKIRTNGYTKVEINAPNDTVHHYDRALTIDITEIAGKSYHEHGEIIGNIEVTKGRVELESTADVYTILLKPAANNDVEIDVQDGASVEVVAPTTDAGSEYIKSEDSIPAESKFEEKVDTTKSQKFSGGGFGTEKNPYLIANDVDAEHIKDFEDDMARGNAYYFRLINDVSIQTTTRNLVYNPKGSSSNFNVFLEFFTGGLDGNGYKLSLIGTDDAAFALQNGKDAIIENLNLVQSSSQGITTLFDYVNMSTSKKTNNGLNNFSEYKVTFKNINNISEDSSYVNVTNSGWLVSQTAGNIDFINCKNYVNLNFTSYGGLIIGNYSIYGKVRVINCSNEGFVTGNNTLGFFTGNLIDKDIQVVNSEAEFNNKECPSDTSTTTYFYLEDNKNNGMLYTSKVVGAFANKAGDSTWNEGIKTINEGLKATQFVIGKSGTISTDIALTVSEKKLKVSYNGTADKYLMMIYASISYAGGSTYVLIKYESQECEAISKFITSEEYLRTYGKSFTEINSNLIRLSQGYEYKLVEINDSYIVVVSTESINKTLGTGMFKNLNSNTTYSVSALDSTGSTLAANIYTKFADITKE